MAQAILAQGSSIASPFTEGFAPHLLPARAATEFAPFCPRVTGPCGDTSTQPPQTKHCHNRNNRTTTTWQPYQNHFFKHNFHNSLSHHNRT